MLHRHATPAVAGSYLTGAVLGAATTATALFVISGLLSPIPAGVRGTAAGLSIALLALHATGVLCLDWLPQRRYQIPRETFVAQPTVAAFRFAFELGTGVRTYITASAPYAAALIIVLCPPAGLGAGSLAVGAAALGYGLGRSLVVALQSMRSATAVEHPARWLRTADVLAVGFALALAVNYLLTSR